MSIEISILFFPENVDVVESSLVFPSEGGTLGRSNNNFWVLQDPNKYMSSVHAKIEEIEGQYYLTDLSTNGTFLNGAAEPIGNGNRVVLNDNDHFIISDYEFVSKIQLASQTADLFSTSALNNTVSDDPFADLDFSTTSVADDDDFMPQSISGDDAFASGNNPFAVTENPSAVNAIDPMSILDRKSAPSNSPLIDSPRSQTQRGPINNQTTNNHFDSPSVVSDAIEWPVAKPEAGKIPDDWDITGLQNSRQSTSKNESLNNQSSVPADPFTDFESSDTPSASSKIPDDFDFNALFANEVASPKNPPQENAMPDGFDLDEQFGNDLNPFETPRVKSNILDTFEHGRSQPESVQYTNQSDPVSSPVLMAAQDVQPSIENNVTQATATIAVTPKIQTPPTQKRSYSEEEYAALKNQNAQLVQQVADLKAQLNKAKQQSTSATTSEMPAHAADLNSVVNAMGLAQWNLTPNKVNEINNVVGTLMRETMLGMMQVLKFRKKIKEEFRINVTTIQSVENNPLKFSANIDDAMENMFIKENNAYKSPVDAVKEGFESIAEHQVAVVAGMQAAFRGMIERFDPQHLESRFEKYNNASFLSLGQKAKHWNDYKAYHKELTENLDDSFQHLFGYDFVQAYEEQMQHLIRARNQENKL